jgi:hypothetical protein
MVARSLNFSFSSCSVGSCAKYKQHYADQQTRTEEVAGLGLRPIRSPLCVCIDTVPHLFSSMVLRSLTPSTLLAKERTSRMRPPPTAVRTCSDNSNGQQLGSAQLADMGSPRPAAWSVAAALQELQACSGVAVRTVVDVSHMTSRHSVASTQRPSIRRDATGNPPAHSPPSLTRLWAQT